MAYDNNIQEPTPNITDNTRMHLKAFGLYLLNNYWFQEGEYWKDKEHDLRLKTEDIVPLYLESEWNPEYTNLSKQDAGLNDLEKRIGAIEGFLNFP